MANPLDTLTRMIEKIIFDATKYQTIRLGIVKKIDDPLKKARILVSVPSLGWITEAHSAWCFPIDKNMLFTPKINDYVYIAFIDGNRNLPVYIGKANKMKNMLPENYEAESQILFESPDNTEDYIKYKYRALQINSENIELNGNDKRLVTYSELNTAIQNLITSINSHIHIGVQVGAGVSGTPSVPMSIDISASETQTLKTGG